MVFKKSDLHIYFGWVRQLSHEEQVVLLGLKPGANADASCSLYLVTRQHPNLNAGGF